MKNINFTVMEHKVKVDIKTMDRLKEITGLSDNGEVISYVLADYVKKEDESKQDSDLRKPL